MHSAQSVVSAAEPLPLQPSEKTSAPPTVRMLRRSTLLGVLTLFFVVIPVLNVAGVIPNHMVNILGKYLCFCIVALGVDLIWGYTGLLSLCQAMFFCLGGYAMAMHLSLPQGGGVYDVPQFLSYVYYGKANPLPPFWRPFQSLSFALAAGIFIPAIVASVFGFFIFRSRVRGVYFSIITQAVAWGAWLLISRHEMLLGGTNGLTNFSKAFDSKRSWILGLYFASLVGVVGAYLLCLWLTRSRLGRVLVAVRDKETRLYFAGYKPYAFKVFAFAVAAMLGGVAGMLYVPQVGIITPQNMTVSESIDMVVLVAVGGRGRLWGAVFGALVVKYIFASLSSDLPMLWMPVLGGMYIAVVLMSKGTDPRNTGIGSTWDKVEQHVASGQVVPAVMAALPLLTLGAFVLGQSTGLTPGLLQKALVFSPAAVTFIKCLAILAGAVGLLVWLLLGLINPASGERGVVWRVTVGGLAAVAALVLAWAAWKGGSSEFQLKHKYTAVILLLGVSAAYARWQKKSAARAQGFEVIQAPAVAGGTAGGAA